MAIEVNELTTEGVRFTIMGMQWMEGVIKNGFLMTSSGFGSLTALPLILAFVAFIYYLSRVVVERRGLFTPILYLIFFPTFLHAALVPSVPVNQISTYGTSQNWTEKAKAKQEVFAALKNQADATSNMAEKRKIQVEMNQIAQDINVKLQLAQLTNGGMNTTMVPEIFASMYNMTTGVRDGLMYALVAANRENPVQSRKTQAMMTKAILDKKMNSLDPGQRLAAKAVLDCYGLQENFARNFSQMVTRKQILEAGIANKQFAADGPEQKEYQMVEAVLQGQMETMQQACSAGDMTMTNMMKDPAFQMEVLSVAAKIRELRGEQGWTSKAKGLFLGMFSPGASNSSDISAMTSSLGTVEETMAGALGIPPDKIKAMSPDEIATQLVAIKYMRSLADAIKRQVDVPEDIAAAGGVNNHHKSEGSLKEWLAEQMMSFSAGFMRIGRTFSEQTMYRFMMFLCLSYPFAMSFALLPKMHLLAPVGFMAALLFLGLWQVGFTMVSASYGRSIADDLVMSDTGAATGGYWNNFTNSGKVGALNGSNAATTIGGTGMAAGTTMRVGSLIAEAATAAKVSGVGLAVTTVGSAGMAVIDASRATSANKVAFDNYIHSYLFNRQTGIGMSKAQQDILSGITDLEHARIAQTINTAEAMEAMMYAMVPLIVAFTFFLGYKFLIPADMGGKAAAMGAGIGSAVMSMGMYAGLRGLGGGGGSKSGGGSGGGGGAKGGRGTRAKDGIEAEDAPPDGGF